MKNDDKIGINVDCVDADCRNKFFMNLEDKYTTDSFAEQCPECGCDNNYSEEYVMDLVKISQVPHTKVLNKFR